MKIYKLILATLIVVSLFAQLNAAPADKEIKWENFEQAIERAQKENKYIVMDVYTDWCQWCKIMDKKTYSDQRIVDLAQKKIIFVKLNAESSDSVTVQNTAITKRELSYALGIEGYPATVFLNPAGEFITRVSGFIEADEFVKILEFIGDEHYKNMSFQEFAEKRD